MLLYTSSEPAIYTVVCESVEGRSGNYPHSSDSIMLPIWERGMSMAISAVAACYSQPSI
jgi:hypothetical protein